MLKSSQFQWLNTEYHLPRGLLSVPVSKQFQGGTPVGEICLLVKTLVLTSSTWIYYKPSAYWSLVYQLSEWFDVVPLKYPHEILWNINYLVGEQTIFCYQTKFTIKILPKLSLWFLSPSPALKNQSPVGYPVPIRHFHQWSSHEKPEEFDALGRELTGKALVKWGHRYVGNVASIASHCCIYLIYIWYNIHIYI